MWPIARWMLRRATCVSRVPGLATRRHDSPIGCEIKEDLKCLQVRSIVRNDRLTLSVKNVYAGHVHAEIRSDHLGRDTSFEVGELEGRRSQNAVPHRVPLIVAKSLKAIEGGHIEVSDRKGCDPLGVDTPLTRDQVRHLEVSRIRLFRGSKRLLLRGEDRGCGGCRGKRRDRVASAASAEQKHPGSYHRTDQHSHAPTVPTPDRRAARYPHSRRTPVALGMPRPGAPRGGRGHRVKAAGEAE